MSSTQHSRVSSKGRPGKQSSAGSATEKSSKSTNSQQPNEEEEEEEPNRDLVTGRILVEDGGSCLRCTEKGLRCTLNFLGVAGADQCAACKRSNAPHCIRQRAPGKLVWFQGPPWKSPNYFSIGGQLSAKEMEEILKEHFQGQETYSHGTFMYESERKNLALPPFNGSDRPIGERPERWMSMNWKRILPLAKNRSFYRQAQLNEKSPLPPSSSSESSSSSSPSPSSSVGSTSSSSSSQKTDSSASQETESDEEEFVSEETIGHMAFARRYPPRNMHLKEYLQEKGETY